MLFLVSTIKPFAMTGNSVPGASTSKRSSSIGQFIGLIEVNFLRLFARRSTYVEIICALFIILFVYTGINKLLDIEKFNLEMGRSPFVEDVSIYIAYLLPPGELLLAAFLIIKRTRLLGLYLSFALMALFTGYIWLMLNYAYDLPCSCGGIMSELSWNAHLMVNAAFTGLGLVAIVIETENIPITKG